MPYQGILMPKAGSATTARIEINKPVVTFGRAASNDTKLDSPKVSRQHATIKLEGDEFYIYDLGSSNGTFVNENQVRAPVMLQSGDVVRMGDQEFVFNKLVT